MSVVELQEFEEVKGLIARGQRVGVLTYAEIATATAVANEVQRAPDKRGRHKAKVPLDLKPDVTTDSLQLFLKDIGKVRLLTAREEVDLAKRIERGDFDAKQKMVESNLRLVVSIAKNLSLIHI